MPLAAWLRGGPHAGASASAARRDTEGRPHVWLWRKGSTRGQCQLTIGPVQRFKGRPGRSAPPGARMLSVLGVVEHTTKFGQDPPYSRWTASACDARSKLRQKPGCVGLWRRSKRLSLEGLGAWMKPRRPFAARDLACARFSLDSFACGVPPWA